MTILPPPEHNLRSFLKRALDEDLEPGGDATTRVLVPPDVHGRGAIVAREAGVAAGLIVLGPLFRILDPFVKAIPELEDGADFPRGATLARLEGPAASILTGERLSLNLVARLSGIATLTRRFVQACEGTGCHVADTRKTTPLLRTLERYAVRCGGGRNHRFNLSDGILIKDNHIAVSGGVREAVERARSSASHPFRIEVEVETLEQAREACDAGADILLLDNMTPEAILRIVAEMGEGVILEASGGITLETAQAYAATGVDFLSVGALTHSARSLDLSLELETEISEDLP